MLAWLLNDEPIPPEHGAPLRLIMPFRYGARWIKAVTEIHFGSPGLPSQPLPA
jgi:DMSO/TMAO reductase YedYZ molybdopterin-dependent catalytic subunit